MSLTLLLPTAGGGGQLATPGPVTAAWSVPSPSVARGAVAMQPDAVVATLAPTSPALARGAVSVSPATLGVAQSVQVPAVSNGFTATPSPIALASSVAAGSVGVGPLGVLVDPATASLVIVPPLVAYVGGEIPAGRGVEVKIPEPKRLKPAQRLSPRPAVSTFIATVPFVSVGRIVAAPLPVAAIVRAPIAELRRGSVSVFPWPVCTLLVVRKNAARVSFVPYDPDDDVAAISAAILSGL